MFFPTSIRLLIKGLFSLFLISSPLLVPASCDNPGRELAQILKGSDCQDAQEHLELARGKDCIVLLGEAGVGKSTLANAMYQGAENMVEVGKDGKPVWNTRDLKRGVYLQPKKPVLIQGKEVFQVGRDFESGTQYPQVAGLNGKVLCDCPGFDSTSEGEKDLINCMAIGKLLKKAGRVKLCFLFSEHSLGRPHVKQKSSRNVLHALANLLKEDHLSADYLGKIQIIVTRPDKVLTKQEAIEYLREMFRRIKIKSAGLDKMLANVMFVDAADRAHRFVDEKISSFGRRCSSPSQDTVAALVEKVCREDGRWFRPEDFHYPLTEAAEDFLENMLKEIRSKAFGILLEGNDPEAVDKIIECLEKLKEYGFPGVDVSAYITAIKNYRNVELGKEEKARLERELSSVRSEYSEYRETKEEETARIKEENASLKGELASVQSEYKVKEEEKANSDSKRKDSEVENKGGGKG